MANELVFDDLTSEIDFVLEDAAALGLSPRTVEGKGFSLKAFSKWCVTEGIVSLSEVDLSALEQYRRYLFKLRQKNGNPLELASIRNRLTAVKMCFKRLHYHGFIDINPAALFELPRVPRQLPKGFLKEAQVEKVLAHTLLYGKLGIRDRAILEVYYATGMRRMELANLELSDIDMLDGVVTIYKGKGRKDRRIPIAKRARQWVQVYLKHIRPDLTGFESGNVLFLSNKRRKYKEHQLTRMAAKYVQRSGVSKTGACNLFRHSTATLMHENGADLRHVQEMLGHADISTTQVYTHVTITKLKEIYRQTHPAAQSVDH